MLSTWTTYGDCCKSWKAITCDKSNGHITHLELFVDPKQDSKKHYLKVMVKSLLPNSQCTFQPCTYTGFFSPTLKHRCFFMLLLHFHLRSWRPKKDRRGTISPALGKLTHLKVLDLHNLKQLLGPLPKALHRLKHLVDLNVELNMLTGKIATVLGNLKALKTLTLSQNRFSGHIPAALGDIGTQLHVLWLGKNKLTGTIPAALYKLTGLNSFYLGDKQLTGEISPLIGQLKKMEALDFFNNKLTGQNPEAMATDLKKLDYLNLSNDQLSGPISKGASFTPSPVDGNAGLCEDPLPPCKN